MTYKLSVYHAEDCRGCDVLLCISGRFNALMRLMEAEAFLTNALGVSYYNFLVHFCLEPGFRGTVNILFNCLIGYLLIID